MVTGPVSSTTSDCPQGSLHDSQPPEGKDGGSCLVGEFAEQHLASWLNSIRLGAPQGENAVSHAQTPWGQCQAPSSRHEVTEAGQTQISFMMFLSTVRGCTQKGVPRPGLADWLSGRKKAEPSARGQSMEKHARQAGVDSVSPRRSIIISKLGKFDSQPYFSQNPDGSILSELW